MTIETTTVEPAASGLLDGVKVEDDSTPASAEATSISHLDGADSGVQPGQVPGTARDKPEWLPENFWNADKGETNVEAMAKSYADIRKVVSQGKHKAPTDGKYDASGLGAEHPMAPALTDWAKENGLSQVAFEDLVGKLQTQAKEIMGDPIDPAEELKALGPNANAVVNGMADWARNLVKKGIWGPDDFEEFKVMGGTAKGLRALMKVRESYEGRIPIDSSPAEGMPSRDELYQMVGDPKYKTDSAYRQKVERMFQQSFT